MILLRLLPLSVRSRWVHSIAELPGGTCRATFMITKAIHQYRILYSRLDSDAGNNNSPPITPTQADNELIMMVGAAWSERLIQIASE